VEGTKAQRHEGCDIRRPSVPSCLSAFVPHRLHPLSFRLHPLFTHR
jgi:hypothetical protein